MTDYEKYKNDPEKLGLSTFRKKLPFNINYGMADIDIKTLINREIEIDFDVFLPSKGKNLQRGFVWTKDQKHELILSILKGIKLPAITVLYLDHKVYKVIDGKQRLCTLIQFMKNEFSINVNNKEYFCSDLTLEAQSELNGSIKSNIGYEYSDKLISDDILIEWFEMINYSGTPQEKDHINNLKN